MLKLLINTEKMSCFNRNHSTGSNFQWPQGTGSDGILEDKIRLKLLFPSILKKIEKTVNNKYVASFFLTYLIATDSDLFVFN